MVALTVDVGREPIQLVLYSEGTSSMYLLMYGRLRKVSMLMLRYEAEWVENSTSTYMYAG